MAWVLFSTALIYRILRVVHHLVEHHFSFVGKAAHLLFRAHFMAHFISLMETTIPATGIQLGTVAHIGQELRKLVIFSIVASVKKAVFLSTANNPDQKQVVSILSARHDSSVKLPEARTNIRG